MKTTDWPYLADQNSYLTTLRIPVEPEPTSWFYIVAFDKESEAQPTEQEALLMQSFLQQYIEHWYRPSWKLKLAEKPFDIDGNANGVIFHKYGEDDWAYRRRSWRVGPRFLPMSPIARQSDWFAKEYYNESTYNKAYSLTALLDLMHTYVGDTKSKDWVEWKAAHPELF